MTLVTAATNLTMVNYKLLYICFINEVYGALIMSITCIIEVPSTSWSTTDGYAWHPLINVIMSSIHI